MWLWQGLKAVGLLISALSMRLIKPSTINGERRFCAAMRVVGIVRRMVRVIDFEFFVSVNTVGIISCGGGFVVYVKICLLCLFGQLVIFKDVTLR